MRKHKSRADPEAGGGLVRTPQRMSQHTFNKTSTLPCSHNPLAS